MPTKLAIGLGALVVLLSVLALGTVERLSRATDRYVTGTRAGFGELLLAERLRAGVEETGATSRGYLLSPHPEFLTRLKRAEAQIERLLIALGAEAGNAEERAAVADIRRAHADYRAVVESAVDRKIERADQNAIVALFDRELVPRRAVLDRALDGFVTGLQDRLAAHHEEVAENRAASLRRALYTLAIGIGVCVLLATFFGRHLAGLYRRERAALERAERATAAREELLAIVAHDLRSPLSAIALRASMLRAGLSEDKARSHGEAIARMVANTDRLLRTMLDLASADAGRLAVDLAACDVGAVLREVLDTFGPIAAARSVTLRGDPGEAAFTIRADRERLVQVLSNLVGNAVKFAPEDSAVEIGVRREGGAVHVSVSDAGPGIRAADLPHIFDRFWKGRNQGSKGTGLGLYIARTIVEAHGGRLVAESRPGERTVFRFTLPDATAPLAAGAAPIAKTEPATATI